MSDISELQRLTPAQGPTQDLFVAARDRLTEFLLGYSLIESYFAFVRARKPYPFLPRTSIVPGSAVPRGEQRHQATAFVILLDEPMPESLIKHFRLRKSNRVTAQNLRNLCSDVAIEQIEPQQLDLASNESDELLRKLLPIDYALLAERTTPGTAPQLSHAHVKIERLTDNAIRDLAMDLGYIERRLFERGEDYVDALEAKYYEYYGFPANASGRKSAAAMAAQLLTTAGTRFTVMLANQDDCRITLLDDGQIITQYLLIRLDRDDAARLVRSAKAFGATDEAPYVVLRDARDAPIVLYRVDFARAAPARGHMRSDADRMLRQPWLEIVDEWIVKVPVAESGEDPGTDLPAALPFVWARPL
ncbi:hypothetical protein [Zavarzinia sp.]|uniref:hypothetical protein n=1 Tax=Zavarzinia sp. TaxID=2027920 RepID=UPI003568BB8F